MSTQQEPPVEDDHRAINQTAVLPVILEEVLRQRKDQDDRLEYQRRVAWLFFSVFLPGAGLAAFWMLRLEGEFEAFWTWAAIVTFAFGVFSTLKVMETQQWQSGPKIQQMIGVPLDEGWHLQKFQYALVISHLREFRANEGKVRSVKRWSSWMVGFFIASVVFLGINMWSYTPSVESPENPENSAAAFAHQQEGPEPPEHDPAPLYDVEPFEPTFVEKGDNSYYEPPFD